MSDFLTFKSKLIPAEQRDRAKRGLYFEMASRWYLDNSAYGQSLFDEVRLPEGIDIGIDLEATDKDGVVWDIQCKDYDPKYAIKKADIDSFISASTAKGADRQMLIIGTTNKIGPNARRMVEDHDIKLILLHELEADEIDWPEDPADLREKHVFVRKDARPHQQAAIDKMIAYFDQGHDRGYVCWPPGVGKTMLSYHYTQQVGSERVLFLVPSLALIAQTVAEWQEQYILNHGERFQFSVVCGDKEIVANGKADKVLWDRSDIPYPTTDPGRVAAEMMTAKGLYVTFCTYQSIDTVIYACHVADMGYDDIIMDEVHHTVGPEGLFSKILHDNLVPAKRRVGLTATPRLISQAKQKKLEDNGIEVYSMDEPEHFGHEIERMTVQEAQKQGLLADYQVLIPLITDTQMKQQIEDREHIEILVDGRPMTVDAQFLATHYAIASMSEEYGMRRILNFTANRNQAQAFSKSHKFLGSDTAHSDYVTGDMPAHKRVEKIDRFLDSEADYSIMTNVHVFSEGVDIPAIDSVVFATAKNSPVEIMQAIGRCLRTNGDPTKLATIMVPVFIDPTDDADQVIDASAFARIKRVLDTIGIFDQVVTEDVEQIKVGHGPVSSRTKRGNVSIIFNGQPLDPKMKTQIRNQILMSSLPFRMVERQKLIVAYAKANGIKKLVDMPRKAVDEHGNPVGVWVSQFASKNRRAKA